MVAKDFRMRIDKEGNWFYNQSPITNRSVCLYLSRHIAKDEQGRFLLQTPNQILPLEVEDTPFIVKHCIVINSMPPKAKVLLNDQTEEIIVWNRIWLGDERHIYCLVKDGAFEARFNRDSQFELGDRLEFDHNRKGYYLLLRDKKFYLAVKQDDDPE